MGPCSLGGVRPSSAAASAATWVNSVLASHDSFPETWLLGTPAHHYMQSSRFGDRPALCDLTLWTWEQCHHAASVTVAILSGLSLDVPGPALPLPLLRRRLHPGAGILACSPCGHWFPHTVELYPPFWRSGSLGGFLLGHWEHAAVHTFPMYKVGRGHEGPLLDPLCIQAEELGSCGPLCLPQYGGSSPFLPNHCF